jgi:hypothetical protein
VAALMTKVSIGIGISDIVVLSSRAEYKTHENAQNRAQQINHLNSPRLHQLVALSTPVPNRLTLRCRRNRARTLNSRLTRQPMKKRAVRKKMKIRFQNSSRALLLMSGLANIRPNDTNPKIEIFS